MEQAADLALAETRSQLEHIERCRRCADSSWLNLHHLSWAERDQAGADVRAALLSNLKPGCSEAEMHQVRDAEVARIHAERLKRRAQEKAEKAAKEKTEAKQRLMEYCRREFDFYLMHLNVAGKLKESAATLVRRELKESVLGDLEQELEGTETTAHATKLMQEIVREALGIRAR